MRRSSPASRSFVLARFRALRALHRDPASGSARGVYQELRPTALALDTGPSHGRRSYSRTRTWLRRCGRKPLARPRLNLLSFDEARRGRRYQIGATALYVLRYRSSGRQPSTVGATHIRIPVGAYMSVRGCPPRLGAGCRGGPIPVQRRAMAEIDQPCWRSAVASTSSFPVNMREVHPPWWILSSPRFRGGEFQ